VVRGAALKECGAAINCAQVQKRKAEMRTRGQQRSGAARSQRARRPNPAAGEMQ